MSGTTYEPEVVSIEYELAGSSEHSGEYVAENILVDRPRDHSSRWSAAYAPNAKQWIRLRLKQLCVLKTITFGKFYKVHPCNMKEFKILVGTNEDNMSEVLHAALKNDVTPETFSIRCTNRAGMTFPTRYVQIVPISYVLHDFYNFDSFSMYNHSLNRRFLTPVHHILAQSGFQLEHPLVTSLHESFVLSGDWRRAEELIRDCASVGLLENYRQACQARTRWTRIKGLDADGDVPCRRGGHAMCIDEMAAVIYLFGGWDGQRNLDDFWAYDIFLDAWRLISPATSRDKNGPGPRACHKMVFDSKTGSIYLLGRLGDADKPELDTATRTRAGHPASGMTDASVLNLREGNVEYVGRDPRIPEASASASARIPPPHTVLPSSYTTSLCSEFYRYHTRGLDYGQWDLLAFDTAASGGPPLISDHQMEIDSEAQMIYVFGGRVADAEWEMLKFSGLYSYDIRTSRWKLYNTSDAYASQPSIPPRFGHSMVLDTRSQTLFIFGGQRDEKYLSDMYAFHIPTNTVTELFSNFSSAGGPDPCFTQRAVLDADSQEIYVFGGLTRAKASAPPALDPDSPYWIYRYERPDVPGRWSRNLADGPAASWPQPRYAHQVVYDSKAKALYMHGGNAGLEGDDPPSDNEGEQRGPAAPDPDARTVYASASGASVPTPSPALAPVADADADMTRMDDFWRLEVIRPTHEEITRRALFEVRKQQFREMCEDAPSIKALTFLQTRVSAVVNHEDAEEAKAFRSLLSAHLLSAFPRGAPETREASGVEDEDSPPPRKRSRPSSPTPVVRWEQDPLEEGGSAPSPERFRQRTEMFERLMAFINEDSKQPDQNLVDMLAEDTLVS
ncbi:hypothetical protein VTO73DRAFT_5080 [Trametes versicolor]